MIYPSALRLRSTHAGRPRPFRTPAIRLCTALATGFIGIGSWVAVFPGTLEAFLGGEYDFKDTRGVSREHFEALTLGTLGVIGAIAVIGCWLGDRRTVSRLEAVEA